MKQHLKTKTLQELAIALGATLRGDPQCRIVGLAPLERAKQGELSFLTSPQYRKYLSGTHASAVLLGQEEADLCSLPVLITDNPRLALAKVAALFDQEEEAEPTGIHSTAIIGEDCLIPKTVSIGAYCVIGNNVVFGEHVVVEAGTVIGSFCEIADNSHLKPRVTLYKKVKMGRNCLIHSGAVLGGDGFGFAQQEGRWVKMPHLAGVTLGDRVEIGANTTVDRGMLEDTFLADDVIIDNLVQIGHNVIIGERTAIAASSAIAGSARIGRDCLLGGGVRISGHLEIGDKVYITGTTGVNHSIMQPGTYSAGFPAKPNAQWRKNVARFQYLDDMAKRLRSLEKHLGVTPVRPMEVE